MAVYEDADAPEGVELYDMEDFDTHRRLIFDDAKTTLEKQFPKVYNGVKMELIGADYADPDNYTIRDQKTALHNDKFLMRRLRGTLKLTDANTGALLDKKTTTLMRVPYLTERGTFIRSGNEWATISQQRLLPGAYTRRQANGELETQFNVRPGTGNAFRINLNPETAVYKFNIAGSNLHLYSLLHDLGVKDDQLKERWGDAVFAANADNYDARVFEKAYNKIVPEWDRKNNPGRSREEKVQLIKDALDRSQISTKVVKKTLPSLFDMTKRAQWRDAGKVLEKCAYKTLKKSDLIELATYLNANMGLNIPVENASQEIIVESIRNVLATGLPDGSLYMGKTNPDDKGAALVRQMRTKNMVDKINSILDKNYDRA